ncbi:efflux transporter periplasmic adaptor subunit [Izhakiella australiensis]|uniref:Efflux transporter periplasmic adaptor subunit n=1 Tax=Izhakiella australiensis TaxID=1926881 RepID=A0A1S8YNA5_9GAMM|nr:efflux RND transporter periplasmic adaptor subunit [Izhakiella australiensis]OON40348.1 efflux transporter periplasmic adaptor subunit [Izhakiella australiensis]
MNKNTYHLLPLVAALWLAGCDSKGAEQSAPPAPGVSVAQVTSRQVSMWDNFNGRIEAVQHVDLRPRVSGYIDKVNFVEGQEVKQGDVLFTIDDRTLRAELAQSEAQLATSRSQAALARSESARSEKLIGTQAISREEWEQRRSAALQASTNVQAAQAAVDMARLNLSFTRVTAPISGRASRAMITAGNLVTAGDSASILTTLVSLDSVYVYFDVDESTFLRYQSMARSGQGAGKDHQVLPVQVALAGEQGYPHRGSVDFTDNQVDSNTGTIRMRALLDNHDRMFTPGLYARVQLPGEASFSALLISDKAILTDQDRRYVWVVDGSGKAQRRDIVAGRNADGLRIITQGLKPDDRVIVDGVQKVMMPGQPVNAHVVAMPTDSL